MHKNLIHLKFIENKKSSLRVYRDLITSFGMLVWYHTRLLQFFCEEMNNSSHKALQMLRALFTR